MIIDEIKAEIESIKKKIQSAINRIDSLTKFGENLQSAFSNTITASAKIDELANSVLAANSDAFARRRDDSGSNFESFYMKNVAGILGDGHIDAAKQSISVIKQSISTKIGDNETEIQFVEKSKTDLENLLSQMLQKIESIVEVI